MRQIRVAALGSVPVTPSPVERIAFWTKLHQRLAPLSNRIDGTAHAAILAAIHARIPMPTPDDQHAVMLDVARADAQFWSTLDALESERVAGLQRAASEAAAAAAEAAPAAAEVADKARRAADRLARAERGQHVDGIGPPIDRKEVMRALGWTASDVRHAKRLQTIEDLGGMARLIDEIARRQKQLRRAAARAVLRREVNGAGTEAVRPEGG